MNPGRGPIAGLVLVLALVVTGSLVTNTALAQPASVRAQLSSPSIAIGESVRLAIVADGIDGELDTAALEREFDIVGRSSSRDVRITNGSRRSTVTWVLELVPRELGVFTVPAVSVGGIESELVTLTVTEQPTGGDRDVFVEAVVDDTAPYVQSQVLLTLSVFLAVDIVEGTLEDPAGDGFEVRRLGDDVRRRETRHGRRYEVTERRLALFPQRSGPLVVEPARLSVTVAGEPASVRGFFAPTRRLTRRTAPIGLDVRPRPSGGSGWWLPAKEVALEERWSADADAEVRVGEPLTRTLGLRARGALDGQLPEVATPRVDGLSIYADDAMRAEEVVAGGIESTLTLSLAVIPERPGTFELPSVEIHWFDVDERRERTASLPARTLTVLPGSRGEAPVVPAASPAPTALAPVGDGASGTAVGERWRTLALGALAGWVTTAVALAFSIRRGGQAAASREDGSAGGRDTRRADAAAVRDARRRVERTAREGDVAALGRAVLERAALQSPDAAPRSLTALADRIDTASGGESDALVLALRRLETKIYGRGVGTGRVVEDLEPDTLAIRLEHALDTLEHVAPTPAPEESALPPL